jgi:hypothetical protein
MILHQFSSPRPRLVENPDLEQVKTLVGKLTVTVTVTSTVAGTTEVGLAVASSTPCTSYDPEVEREEFPE